MNRNIHYVVLIYVHRLFFINLSFLILQRPICLSIEILLYFIDLIFK